MEIVGNLRNEYYKVPKEFIDDFEDLKSIIMNMKDELEINIGLYILSFKYIVSEYTGIGDSGSYIPEIFQRGNGILINNSFRFITKNMMYVIETSLSELADFLREITGETKKFSLREMKDILEQLQKPPSDDSLTFKSLKPDAKLRILKYGKEQKANIQYSTKSGEWKDYNFNETITLPYIGSWVQFRNTKSYLSNSDGVYYQCETIKGEMSVSGDIQSMLNYSDYCPNYSFYRFFESCSHITDAHNLILSATSLDNYCYYNMFSNSGIKTSPKFVEASLATGCFMNMFAQSDLVEAPSILPSRELYPYCYAGMFQHTSIRVSPILPAALLFEGCYSYMFSNCKNLKEITMCANDWVVGATDGWVYDVPGGGTLYCSSNIYNYPVYSEDRIPYEWNLQLAKKSFIYLRKSGTDEDYKLYHLDNDEYGDKAIYKLDDNYSTSMDKYLIYYNNKWVLVDELKENYIPQFDIDDNDGKGFDYFVQGQEAFVIEAQTSLSLNGTYFIDTLFNVGQHGVNLYNFNKCDFIGYDSGSSSKMFVNYIGELVYAEGDTPPPLEFENTYAIQDIYQNYYAYTYENLMNFFSYEEGTKVRFTTNDTEVIELEYTAKPRLLTTSPYF